MGTKVGLIFLSSCVVMLCGCASKVEKVRPVNLDVIDEMNCKHVPPRDVQDRLRAMGFDSKEICAGVSLKDAVWKLHERLARIENAD